MKTPRQPLMSKSGHARLVQYRARKQAAYSSVGRLLTRAALYQCSNVACSDLVQEPREAKVECVIAGAQVFSVGEDDSHSQRLDLGLSPQIPEPGLRV